jgi:hypothetical protein
MWQAEFAAHGLYQQWCKSQGGLRHEWHSLTAVRIRHSRVQVDFIELEILPDFEFRAKSL